MKRGVFPEPVHIVQATPLWTREQIENYKAKQNKSATQK